MALAEPAAVIASTRTLAVCTTCARRLLDKGYPKAGGEITYGDPCEAHPTRLRPPATSLVTAPESECTTPVDLGPVAVDLDEDDDPDGIFEGEAREIMRAAETAAPDFVEVKARLGAFHVRATEVGAETEIATRLLVAWSTAERVADDMMIGEAVRVARALLAKTGGR